MHTDQRHQITRRVTLTGAAVNLVLAALQISFGLLGKSQALLADGVHTLSDLGTDFIVFFASRRSSRAADKSHPYGHGRIETIASLLLGAILGMVGIGIGLRGIDSIINPTNVNPEFITLVFACLAIVAKEGLYRYTIYAARNTHSALLEANAWHHRSDALSSIVVTVGISAQLLGFAYMDAVAAIIVGIMVSWIGVRLARKALYELIDTSLDAELIGQVRALMQANPSVVGVHNLRSRSMGGLGYLDAHIEVDADLTVSEAHYIAHRIEHKVKKSFPRIIDLQIHIDPMNDTIRESVLARLPDRQEIEQDLAQAWSGIDASELIQQIRLHYLDRLIEIDLVLPARLCTREQQPMIEQLRRGASELPYIGQVNIYFVG